MNLNLRHIAKACHEANRAYCEFLGDKSQVPWHQAPTDIKESAMNGAAYLIRNPTAPATASHENWMKHKIAAGWKYGEKKDATAKTHPCLVPFEKLPKEQQFKDHLFHAIVRALERP